MNSASATTITVNTALFAAGDTVQIQNVGSGVCTVTAGTATVSTSATLALKQYDAGTLYFNTTSAAFFFAVDAADGMANVLTTTGDIIYSSSGTTAARLGIGSSAQVLTVSGGIPAWSAPAAGGKVLQVVSANYSTSTSNSTSTFADTGLTATITPTLNTSKVLVIVSQNGCTKSAGNSQNRISMRLLRGATNILSLGDYFGYDGITTEVIGESISCNYLDSPATTSATTYKTQFQNPQNVASVSVQFTSSHNSTITLLEIGA
jgi:hypothetical protein